MVRGEIVRGHEREVPLPPFGFFRSFRPTLEFGFSPNYEMGTGKPRMNTAETKTEADGFFPAPSKQPARSQASGNCFNRSVPNNTTPPAVGTSRFWVRSEEMERAQVLLPQPANRREALGSSSEVERFRVQFRQ